jgi:hypothetical protein
MKRILFLVFCLIFAGCGRSIYDNSYGETDYFIDYSAYEDKGFFFDGV